MDLSIIIVNWNTRDLLRDCLKSVFANLGALRAEVFVVDNASSDGSPSMVLKEFARVKLVRNTENLGFASANNVAMRLAAGRYVLLLNSDTLVHGEVLTCCFEFMEQNARAGMMGCRVHNSDGSLQFSNSRFPSLTNLTLLTTGLSRMPWPRSFDRYQMRRWQRRDARQVEVISGCFMFARAAAIAQVGLMDEDFFFFGEETDWCRRFLQSGWELWYAPVGVITHHGGGSSKSLNHRRDLLLTNGTVRLHRKHGGLAAAALCWLLLLGFNASRALFWSLLATIMPSEARAARARHFQGVLGNYASAWPRQEGIEA
jgi:GT2 family glycosyltransferase